MTPDEQLAEDMGCFCEDPLGFVMYSFPWDSNSVLQLVELQEPWRKKYDCKYGPDAWACEFLDSVRKEVRDRKFDGRNAVSAIRGAVTSGHGIGKSALTAWLVMWIMSTRPYAQGTVTANTAPQLQTKTWAQIAKWKNLCVTSHWFEINTGRGNMRMYHKYYSDTWFCSAQTCREENSEAFAGQHAANSTSFYIFDEASAVPNSIKEVAEGGLTDGEPMFFAFGNPTRNTGWFYETFGKNVGKWIARRVDSRQVQITNKKQLQEWIDEYGADSDFVKVRIKGQAPSASTNQLIARALAEDAALRKINPHDCKYAPVILGVDPAWEGDDRTAVFLRQGNHSKLLKEWRGLGDDVLKAGVIAQFWREYNADACFVDVGWGTGIISVLRSIGLDPIPINFGGSAIKDEYVNKRMEVWDEMRKWLEGGGCIENNSDLIEDLVGPDFTFATNGKKLLESKKAMKMRGLQSPDLADALALTFAHPVFKKSYLNNGRGNNMCKVDENILDR